MRCASARGDAIWRRNRDLQKRRPARLGLLRRSHPALSRAARTGTLNPKLHSTRPGGECTRRRHQIRRIEESGAPRVPKIARARARSSLALTERLIPDHIRKRFVQVGHRYYFPDGAHAFTDRGTRLVTPSENTEVVKSLIGSPRRAAGSRSR